jgi:hypothetical protein
VPSVYFTFFSHEDSYFQPSDWRRNILTQWGACGANVLCWFKLAHHVLFLPQEQSWIYHKSHSIGKILILAPEEFWRSLITRSNTRSTLDAQFDAHESLYRTMVMVIQCSPIAFVPPPFKGRRKPRMSQEHAAPIVPHNNDILMGRGGKNRIPCIQSWMLTTS